MNYYRRLWVLPVWALTSIFTVFGSESEEATMGTGDRGLTFISLKGEEAKQYGNEIANMRITLFAGYPYLYEGNNECEKEYLATYFESKNSILCLAFDNDKLVGCATSIPLSEETPEVQAPFLKNNENINDYLYLGEAMIAEPYRGMRVLQKFSEFYDNLAREKGYRRLVFMAIYRPEDDPRRPPDYKSPDLICNRFGYHKINGDRIKISWKSVDTHLPTENLLDIWCKDIIQE